MTDYKATPEQWRQIENSQVFNATFQTCVLELRSRVEKLELRDRIEALEVAENERRFREGSKLIDEATPEQIRAAVNPASTLVEQLACMCADFASTAKAGQSAKPLARAAILEVAAWIKRRQEDDYGVVIPDVREVIDWLEREAKR